METLFVGICRTKINKYNQKKNNKNDKKQMNEIERENKK